MIGREYSGLAKNSSIGATDDCSGVAITGCDTGLVGCSSTWKKCVQLGQVNATTRLSLLIWNRIALEQAGQSTSINSLMPTFPVAESVRPLGLAQIGCNLTPSIVESRELQFYPRDYVKARKSRGGGSPTDISKVSGAPPKRYR